jgi:hypothetical protein
MKKVIVGSVLAAGVAAAMFGAGSANADTRYDYDGKTPDQLVQLSLIRAASLPAGQVKGLQLAHQAFVAGHDAEAKAILVNIVDGPQWAADPALEALAQVLPKPIGGTNGDTKTSEVGGARHEADGTLLQKRNAAVSPGGIRDKVRAHVTAGEDNAAKVRDAIKGALAPKPTK